MLSHGHQAPALRWFRWPGVRGRLNHSWDHWPVSRSFQLPIFHLGLVQRLTLWARYPCGPHPIPARCDQQQRFLPHPGGGSVDSSPTHIHSPSVARGWRRWEEQSRPVLHPGPPGSGFLCGSRLAAQLPPPDRAAFHGLGEGQAPGLSGEGPHPERVCRAVGRQTCTLLSHTRPWGIGVSLPPILQPRKLRHREGNEVLEATLGSYLHSRRGGAWLVVMAVHPRMRTGVAYMGGRPCWCGCTRECW